MAQTKAEHPLPVRAFMEALEKWVVAVNAGELEEAAFQAEQGKAIGRLLAYDPEFKRIFLERRRGCTLDEVVQVLDCVYDFLCAVSNAAMSGEYRKPISHEQTSRL